MKKGLAIGITGLVLLLSSFPCSQKQKISKKENLENKTIQKISINDTIPKKIIAKEFTKLEPPYYSEDIYHKKIEWEEISKGLYFSRIEVHRGEKLIDIIAALKIDPEHNKLKVFNGYSYSNPDDSKTLIIEDWQKETGALAMINSAQYMADPYYMPCALVICDGKQKGPKFNGAERAMLVSEPVDGLKDSLKKMDLLDFKYDKKFDYKNQNYNQGVKHWPVLLDRYGKIRVNKTNWQANRTVVAKDFEDNILFLTTEGGFFTLYNFGRFLKESNQRPDKGFNIHTAMNMDGGYEANMIVKTPKLEYVTYGEFETYGLEFDATIFNTKIKIPGVIGVFPRD